jgi:hypothetical protein
MIIRNILGLIQLTESKEEILHKIVGFGLKHIPNKITGVALSSPKVGLDLASHVTNKILPKAISVSEKFNKHGLASTLKEHHKTLTDGLAKIDAPKIKEALNSEGVKSFKHHVNHIVKHTQKKYADDYASIAKQNPHLSPKDVMSEANKKIHTHIADGISSLKVNPMIEVRRDLTKTEKGTLYGTGAFTTYNTIKPNDSK